MNILVSADSPYYDLMESLADKATLLPTSMHVMMEFSDETIHARFKPTEIDDPTFNNMSIKTRAVFLLRWMAMEWHLTFEEFMQYETRNTMDDYDKVENTVGLFNFQQWLASDTEDNPLITRMISKETGKP